MNMSQHLGTIPLRVAVIFLDPVKPNAPVYGSNRTFLFRSISAMAWLLKRLVLAAPALVHFLKNCARLALFTPHY